MTWSMKSVERGRVNVLEMKYYFFCTGDTYG